MFDSIVCHENAAGETFASFEPAGEDTGGGYVAFNPDGSVSACLSDENGDDFAA